MKNNRGYTIVELLIVSGSSIVMVLGMVTFFFNFKDQIVRHEDQIADDLDTEIARRYISKDLNASYYSLNVLNLKSDDGQNFWDFYPDYPSRLVDNSSRKFTLTQSNEILLVVTDKYFPKAVYYPPSKAYSISEENLGFSSLNYKNFLNKQSMEYNSTKMNMWSDNRTLLLHSPVNKRIANKSGEYSMSSTPRAPFFLGKVSGSQLVRNQMIPLLPGNIQSGSHYSSPDDFLRSLPVVGGGRVFAFVSAVRLVSYRIRVIDGVPKLVRIYWSDNNGYAVGSPADGAYNIMASAVKQAVFKRKDISDTEISIDIVFNKTEDKK